MRVIRFATTSPQFPPVRFAKDKPVSVFFGTSVYPNLMKSLLDAEVNDPPSTEVITDQIFESCVTFEVDGKQGEITGTLGCNGEFSITGKWKSQVCNSDRDDLWQNRKSDRRNNYHPEIGRNRLSTRLGECERQMAELKAFLSLVEQETRRGDRRPIYIFELFDRLDEAIDISPVLDHLASLGRQVFITVSANYPAEKMTHPQVQKITIKTNKTILS